MPWFNPQRRPAFLWLKAKFMLPKEWRGRRIRLFFKGLHWTHRLYVNGRLVSWSGLASMRPVVVDVTEVVKFEPRWNLLHILLGPPHLFLSEVTGLSPPRGGYPVVKDGFLEALPQVYIDDVWVVTSVRKRLLEARVWVRNSFGRPIEVMVGQRVRGKGKEVWDGGKPVRVRLRSREIKEVPLKGLGKSPGSGRRMTPTSIGTRPCFSTDGFLLASTNSFGSPNTSASRSR